MRHNLKLKSLSVDEDSVTVFIENSSNSHARDFLEESWAKMTKAVLGETELCLGFQKQCKRAHDNTQLSSLVVLREFAETEHQANKLTQTLAAMRSIIQTVQSGGETTLRDIYYKDVSTYCGNQENSNAALNLISSSLGVALESMGIFPSPKGLIYGGPHLDLSWGCKGQLTLRYSNECALIPSLKSQNVTSSVSHVDAVVILEKEAVFKSFTSFLSTKNCYKKLVVMTGKGFPDRATTCMLEALLAQFPNVPVLVFVDSDVYGLRIFWMYLQKIRRSNPSVFLAGSFLLEHKNERLTLSKREWKLMINFLTQVSAHSFGETVGDRNVKLIHRELCRGLLLGKKAELNAVRDTSGANNVNDYLWEKIAETIGGK